MTNIAPTPSPLGAAVAARMAEKSLSQMKLAKAAGVPQASISDLVNGKVSTLKLENVQALAGALDTSVGELLGEAPQTSPAGDAAAVLVPFNKLRASPLNPRRTFNQDDLMELAASLRAQGMLQALTVRPDPERPDGYEVLIGGRRLRAAGLLVEDGPAAEGWAEDHPIPVTINPCDDAGALAIATVENVQREDMHPLEEADACVELRKTLSTKQISDMLGKGQRWVQERLRIAEKLDNRAKEAFAAGKINLATVREISRAPAETQEATMAIVAEAIDRGEDVETWDIREVSTDPFPPVTAAIFDRAEYDGGIIPGGEDDQWHECGEDPERFEDVAQFQKLQNAAIARLVEELRSEHEWVDVCHERNHWRPGRLNGYEPLETNTTGDTEFTPIWGDETPIAGKKAGGAVVRIGPTTLEVKVFSSLKRRGGDDEHSGVSSSPMPGQASQPSAKPKKKDPVERVTTARRVLARNVKSEVLQNALCDNLTVALRVACASLIGAREACRIKAEPPNAQDRGVAGAMLETQMSQLVDKLNADGVMPILEISGEAPACTAQFNSYGRSGRRHSGAELLRRITNLSEKDLERLFCALVARETGSFTAQYRPVDTELGDPEMTTAIADTLGTATEAYWRIDQAYLDTLRKDDLVALGWRIGMTGRDGMPHVNPINELAKLRTDDLRTEVLNYVEANDVRHIPAEMQIQGRLVTEAAIRREAEEAPEK